jgi:adenylyl- and sulfurtransferase ThiI
MLRERRAHVFVSLIINKNIYVVAKTLKGEGGMPLG